MRDITIKSDCVNVVKYIPQCSHLVQPSRYLDFCSKAIAKNPNWHLSLATREASQAVDALARKAKKKKFYLGCQGSSPCIRLFFLSHSAYMLYLKKKKHIQK